MKMAKYDFTEKVNEILCNRNIFDNIDHIRDVMKDDEKSVLPGILSLERVFTELFKSGDFIVEEKLKLTNRNEYEEKCDYAGRLFKYYEDLVSNLCDVMVNSNCGKSVQQEALSSILRLSAIEDQFQIIRKERNPCLPTRLKGVIKCILVSNNTAGLLVRFEEFIQLKDVLFFTWKVLRDMLPAMKQDSDDFVTNTLLLLEKIPLPKKIADENHEVARDELLCLPLESKPFTLDVGLMKKWMTQVWKRLIGLTVGAKVLRHLLLVLVESYLPHIQKPIFLTDFFMSCMSIGGPTSLLALQGMSVLMQKHNIEYPNVYGKLYTMFEPGILNSKYRSRLFHLSNIFLSSLYLPEQLVAAFVKRIARLSLKCQVPEAVLGIRFIGNLLQRHPGVKKLIHHPIGGEVEEDPFDITETDPLKSRAMESSLWELTLLKRHAQPRVASAALFIDGALPAVEWDLVPLLDTTSQQIFEIEMKKKLKSTTLTFVRPHGSIAQLSDDRLYKMWSLT